MTSYNLSTGHRRSAGPGQIIPGDVATLREAWRLSQDEGINLAGIRLVLALESEVERLREQAGLLRDAAGPGRRVFTRRARGEVVAVPRGHCAARVSGAGRSPSGGRTGAG